MRIKTAIQSVLASRLGKAAGIYTFANIINSSIPFLLLPVMTRYLSPYDYGIVAMFQVLLGIMGVLVGKSIKSAVARQYYERESIDLPAYVTNCLSVVALSTAGVALLVWMFSGFIATATAFPAEWLWAVLAVAVGQVITLLVLTMWQVQDKPYKYSKFQVSLSLVNAGLSIWLVVSVGMNWEGRINAQIIAFTVFAIIGLVILGRAGWLKWSFNTIYIKQILNYTVPLMPHTLGMLAISMTDRILITNMVGIGDMGIYVVAVQLGMVIGLLVDSFHSAWTPWLYSRLKKDELALKYRIVKFTYFYYVAILIIALVYTAFTPWIIELMVGKEFASAEHFIIWIALGFAFHGMYRMVTSYIFYVRKTSWLAGITFFTAVANVILSYFLIKLNGTVGAAQGTMLAYFISFVLTWIAAARLFKMPWVLGTHTQT